VSNAWATATEGGGRTCTVRLLEKTAGHGQGLRLGPVLPAAGSSFLSCVGFAAACGFAAWCSACAKELGSSLGGTVHKDGGLGHKNASDWI